MRSDTTVEKKKALVVYLGGLFLTYDQQRINQALKNSDMGLPSTAGCIREFLQPNSPTCVIRKGQFSKRLRVTVFFCDGMPPDLKRAFFPSKIQPRVIVQLGMTLLIL